MRVVHVMKVTGIAGAERHLLTLAAGLRGEQIDAQIVLLVEPKTPMDDLVAAAEARGIPVRREIIRRDLDARLFGRLQGLFRKLKPDVAHTHLQHADLFGIPAARLAGIPVVVTSRHNDNAFRRQTLIRGTNAMLWNGVDAGIAISEAVRQFCIEVENAPPRRVHTIHYGLDGVPEEAKRSADRADFRAEMGAGPNTVLIGMVCRLVEQKGVRYGIQAFAQVAARYRDACLVIAGDGPLRGALEAEAAATGLGERIRFLGWRKDPMRVFAGLDLLLVPSLWEGFGLAMLEAMAVQTPIVGSAVSAIPEVVVHGETGLLVPPRDVDGLAAALDTLLADAPLRQYMGLQGQDRLEETFSAARMVDETASLYRHLLERRRENHHG